MFTRVSRAESFSYGSSLVLFSLSLWTKRYAKNKYIWKKEEARREASLPRLRIPFYYPSPPSRIRLYYCNCTRFVSHSFQSFFSISNDTGEKG